MTTCASLKRESNKKTTTKSKQDYIQFEGNDEKMFYEYVVDKKTIDARKGWVKALTKGLTIDQKSADNVMKKAIMMNNLA